MPMLLHKRSDSETDRLQDIQKEPRRRIGPSHVKELAKFFTPTSDEEENSHVNNQDKTQEAFWAEEGGGEWKINIVIWL